MPVTTSLLSLVRFFLNCKSGIRIFFFFMILYLLFPISAPFQVSGRFYYGFPLAILCYSIYCHFKRRQRCFPWRIFYLIPEHGMCFFFPLFFSFQFLFQLYSLSLRVLNAYFHPSDSEEFLYQDGHSDIAHDISAETTE